MRQLLKSSRYVEEKFLQPPIGKLRWNSMHKLNAHTSYERIRKANSKKQAQQRARGSSSSHPYRDHHWFIVYRCVCTLSFHWCSNIQVIPKSMNREATDYYSDLSVTVCDVIAKYSRLYQVALYCELSNTVCVYRCGVDFLKYLYVRFPLLLIWQGHF
jgi:hypothetical protein